MKRLIASIIILMCNEVFHNYTWLNSMVKEQWQTSGVARPSNDTTTIELPPAQLLTGRLLRNDQPIMDSLLQPTSVNQKDVSRYLKKTLEDQKAYHDRNTNGEIKELLPGTKVQMRPGTNPRE